MAAVSLSPSSGATIPGPSPSPASARRTDPVAVRDHPAADLAHPAPWSAPAPALPWRAMPPSPVAASRSRRLQRPCHRPSTLAPPRRQPRRPTNYLAAVVLSGAAPWQASASTLAEIGRASGRERVSSYV